MRRERKGIWAEGRENEARGEVRAKKRGRLFFLFIVHKVIICGVDIIINFAVLAL